MILGLPLLVFLHTLMSVVALGAGIVVVAGVLRSRLLGRWTAFFLGLMILTDLTGLVMPAPEFPASHAVGIVSLVILLMAIIARYIRHLSGPWRPIYAVAAVLSLYFDVLALMAQTRSQPPFALVQGIMLLAFIALATAAAISFDPRRR